MYTQHNYKVMSCFYITDTHAKKLNIVRRIEQLLSFEGNYGEKEASTFYLRSPVFHSIGYSIVLEDVGLRSSTQPTVDSRINLTNDI